MQIFYANDNVLWVNAEKNWLGNNKSGKKRMNSLAAANNMDIYFSTGLGKPHFLFGDMEKHISISLTADDYHGGKSNWLIS